MANKFPTELKYSKDHEWVRIENNTATVGITSHAQEALGEIVFVDLPKVGRELKAGEVLGVVESIKAVSDVYCPVAGKVVEVHEALSQEPGLVNADSFGKGWLIKLDLNSEAASATSNLMDASAYEKFVATL